MSNIYQQLFVSVLFLFVLLPLWTGVELWRAWRLYRAGAEYDERIASAQGMMIAWFVVGLLLVIVWQWV